MMKSFFKKLAFVMALAMVVSLAAPAATTASAAEDKKPLAIAYQKGAAITALNLSEVGATEDLRFVYAPTNWKDLDVKWESSNPEVVSVDANGVVKAEAAGTATVTVTVGDEVASIDVYSVDMKTFDVTIGTAEERELTEKTLKVGDFVDFKFFGVQDYDVDYYNCVWGYAEVLGEDVIEFDAARGDVTAKNPGKVIVTLTVINKLTLASIKVQNVEVTVEAEEEPVVAGITVKQTTEDTIVVNLSGLDATSYDKYDFEVYAVMEDSYEYAWQHYNAYPDKDTNTVTLVGYNELEHQQYYVVRIVSDEDADGNNTTLFETNFTASVGPVNDIEIEYASYFNNQGYWTFKNYAYTNGNEGEEIYTNLTYKLYDAAGIDVTDHYNKIADNGGYDIVSYEIIDDANLVTPYVDIYDADVTGDGYEETVMTFSDFLEAPLVIRAVFEDYDDFLKAVNTKEDVEQINVQKAPEYRINGLDKWDIAISDDDSIGWWELTGRQWMALYDDYDEAGDRELLNHHVVLWFTDNYGNKFTTMSEWNNDYQPISESVKFNNEGYEIHFETRHPQILVMGETEYDTTTDNTITSKKVGTAKVNVTLHNTVRDNVNSTLVNHIDALSVVVKAERYVKSVEVSNLQLTTDSIPVGAPTSKVSSTATYGDYDTRWTTGTEKIYVKDQYGVAWGTVNWTRFDDVTVTVTTDANVAETEVTLTSYDYDNNCWKKSYDGAQLLEQLGGEDSKVSYVKYNVAAFDALEEKTVKNSYNVSLKQPTHDDNDDIVVSSALKLSASSNNYVSGHWDGFMTTIKVVEQSKNGLNVNYADGITLITSKDEYDAIFDSTTATAAVGSLYVVVYNPEGKIVEAASGSGIGLIESESGLYYFRYADTKDGNAPTEFAKAGNYKVKVLQVTGTTSTGKVAFKTPYNATFSLTDDRMQVYFSNQESISVATNDILNIANWAFSYNVAKWATSDGVWYDYTTNAGIIGVEFRENTRANSVVVRNVYFQVYCDGNYENYVRGNQTWYNSNAYYYVEVPVNCTVRFDGSAISGTNYQKITDLPDTATRN